MSLDCCCGGQLADMPNSSNRFFSKLFARLFRSEEIDPERSVMSQDIHVLALVKGEERYIFLFNDKHRGEALRTLGRFATNPELSFSWYDAAVLSQKIRQVTDRRETVEEPVAMHSRMRSDFPVSE